MSLMNDLMNKQPQPVVALKAITKRFGNVVANNTVDFELFPGEIHGLLGENGAGKTTLMNILYGMHLPDSGEVFINGEMKVIHSPHDAIQSGIGMVHQHFMQVPTLTVVDNIILGLQRATELRLNREQARKRIINLSATYGLSIDPDAYIWQLSIGDRQRVEILKALYRNVKVLILDEPTSVLTPKEAEELFHTIKKMSEDGLSVIFITHNLEEALSITDQITVLRNGQVMATVESVSTTRSECATLMVGREVLLPSQNTDTLKSNQADVLTVQNISAVGDRGILAVKNISFKVQRGEIVGIAGVDGNGQSELVQALTGLRRVSEGNFTINGKDLTHAAPRNILQHGLGHIPENLDDALILNFSLTENLCLNTHYTPEFSTGGVIDQKKLAEHARELIDRYDIRAPNESVSVKTLSGGNKQKLVVAREISRNPQILIAAHPTRGVDIAAEEYIHRLLLQKRKEGMGILLISTKLDEILCLSDRILVMERGRLMGEMTREEADLETIGLLMAGSEAAIS
jgi:general nucleoside transport system ATP-binding protein